MIETILKVCAVVNLACIIVLISTLTTKTREEKKDGKDK